MSGGFLRFQAQYLRRIRLPRWEQVTQTMREELIAVAGAKDQASIDEPVFRLYDLTATEAELTQEMAGDAHMANRDTLLPQINLARDKVGVQFPPPPVPTAPCSVHPRSIRPSSSGESPADGVLRIKGQRRHTHSNPSANSFNGAHAVPSNTMCCDGGDLLDCQVVTPSEPPT